MILMIDNYDSFTYNLVHILTDLDKEVVVWKNDEKDASAIADLKPSHIVISPGPGRPRDSGISTDVVRLYHNKIPLLGVCLGHQCIGEFFGGQVVRGPVIMHGKTSLITHTQKRLFAEIPTPLQVTRYHSLVLAPDSIPTVLKETAWVMDGKVKTNMAVEHTSYPVFGVQFHPESFMSDHGHTLMKNFISY